MDSERLGARLRMARDHARLTQTEAAHALGIASATLSQYESGKRRVDALTLERLGRIYGVPAPYFFGRESQVPEWEEALRLKAEAVTPESKVGIGRLIEKLRALEELYRATDTEFPGSPHPPFASIRDSSVSEEEVAELAEKTRRHYDLGMAPLPDLRTFLEAQGYKTFSLSLDRGEGQLSGFSFEHQWLGQIVVVNENQSMTRRPFTMAHELAHRLFHYDRPAILSRAADSHPLEVFADHFATHFLVPEEALHERLRDQGMKLVKHPEEIVHLCRYFGVSYIAMKRRLQEEHRLSESVEDSNVKPVTLARALGYATSPYEFGLRPLPPEERLPRVFLELAYRAVGEGKLSPRRVAEMLGISDLELEERLHPETDEGLEEAYV